MDQSRKPIDRGKPARRLWFWLTFATLSGLGYILFNSTPDTIGPIGITTFFILLAGWLFSGLMWLRARLFTQPTSVSLLAAIILSVLSTGAIALNTIDIQAGEIFLMVVFGAMLSIYWLKVRKAT